VDLQEQLEVGKQAEAFLRYVSENPYFPNLLERVKLEFARRILDLRPGDAAHFSDYRSQIEGVDQVMNAIRGDISLGADALSELKGEKRDAGGLL